MDEKWDVDWKSNVVDGSVIETKMLTHLARFIVFYDEDENGLMMKDRYNHKYSLDFVDEARILGTIYDDPKLSDQ